MFVPSLSWQMIVGSSKRETCAKIGRRVFAAPGSLRGRSARQSACTCSGEEHDEGKSTAKSARKSAPSHRSADLGADSKEAIREMFFPHHIPRSRYCSSRIAPRPPSIYTTSLRGEDPALPESQGHRLTPSMPELGG